MRACLHILHGMDPDRPGFRYEFYVLAFAERGATYARQPMKHLAYPGWEHLVEKLVAAGIDADEISRAQKILENNPAYTILDVELTNEQLSTLGFEESRGSVTPISSPASTN